MSTVMGRTRNFCCRTKRQGLVAAPIRTFSGSAPNVRLGSAVRMLSVLLCAMSPPWADRRWAAAFDPLQALGRSASGLAMRQLLGDWDELCLQLSPPERQCDIRPCRCSRVRPREATNRIINVGLLVAFRHFQFSCRYVDQPATG